MYKLLIVEDNKVQIQIVNMFLEAVASNFSEIRTAKNGKEGLEICKEFMPDIIISDVLMPVMNGLEMVNEIRKIYSPKIIFISAYDEFAYVKKAIDYEVSSYILKPIKESDFISGIKKAIKSIDQNHELIMLRENADEYMVAFRENFLYALANAQSSGISDIYDTKKLDFSEYKHFIFIVVNVCKQDGDYDFESLFNVYKDLSDILPDNRSGIILNKNTFVYLLFSKDKSDFESIAETMSEFTEIQAEYSISAGLSGICPDIANAREYFNQALSALENKYEPIYKNIFRFNKLEDSVTSGSLDGFKESVDSLLDNYSKESAEKLIDIYFSDESENRYDLRINCYYAISILQTVMRERNLNMNDIFDNLVIEKMNKFDTILNPKQFLKNILFSICDYLLSTERNKYAKIINDVKKYIEENYASITNIGQIAEHISLSTSYTKKIFKAYTNMTVFDYLTHIRINEAKRMLQNPYIKVYEVSDAVGYKSKDHFSEIFKKYVGVSPVEYQKKS